MAGALADLIRGEIRRDGPIPFPRWMDLCLYHPEHGYYMRPGRKTGTGRDADFATPPTLHPAFGAAVGKELAAAWREAGAPSEWRVVEAGGGEGDLARHAVAWMDRGEPRLAAAVRWMHVEPSPEHRRRQAEAADPRIAPAPARPDAREAHAVVACEVVDALPFEAFRAAGGGSWESLHVGLDGDRFVEAWLPSPSPPPGTGLPAEPGRQVVVHAEVGAWLAGLVGPSTRAAVVVDYGRKGPLPRGAEAVRAYRGQSEVAWTERPGEVDLTASVDFAQVADAAAALGLREASFGSLEAFLLRHGVLDDLNRIDRGTVEGASSYLRLRQLLLPTGLGAAFKVQVFERAARPRAPGGAG